MTDGERAYLDDNLWSFIEGTSPTFALLGEADDIEEAALHIAAYGHPFFGRVKIVAVDRPEVTDRLNERFAIAISMNLIVFENGSLDEKTIKGSVVLDLRKQHDDLTALNPQKIVVLQEKQPVLSEKDIYQKVVAFLSLYGKTLHEFNLPNGDVPTCENRDWRYLGPARGIAAFDLIENDILLGLKENEGSLFPVDCHDVLLAAIKGEEVDPVALYGALIGCYTTPCLLRDMASHIHDCWTLRTFAFHPDAASKKGMMVPYPLLLAHELPKIKGADEASFASDILFSDYLVPLLAIRRYAERA